MNRIEEKLWYLGFWPMQLSAYKAKIRMMKVLDYPKYAKLCAAAQNGDLNKINELVNIAHGADTGKNG